MAGEVRGQHMGSSVGHGALDYILKIMGKRFGRGGTQADLYS